uniref:transposase n=1 Tax=Saccharopolyspora elongata TaxID=2530387 RepID=UPI001A9FB721|nr:transposase [Saccharopolyspora elongata]
MAERLGVDHQGLQQFITSSTWEHGQVRANVARWASETIDPEAYVVDDTGFAKDGDSKITYCHRATKISSVTSP